MSNYPDSGLAPLITFICIPILPFSINPTPDDLRVRLNPDQFFECVKRFPGFPNVMTMVGDGWVYWNAWLAMDLPGYDFGWMRERVRAAIRITTHRSMSYELLHHLLQHENLYDGARYTLLGVESVGAVVLFDNPKVNSVYAIQNITSSPAHRVLRVFLKRNGIQKNKDPLSIAHFQLLWWIIQREFRLPQ